MRTFTKQEAILIEKFIAKDCPEMEIFTDNIVNQVGYSPTVFLEDKSIGYSIFTMNIKPNEMILEKYQNGKFVAQISLI